MFAPTPLMILMDDDGSSVSDDGRTVVPDAAAGDEFGRAPWRSMGTTAVVGTTTVK